jgi:hypothetical protein
MSSRHTRKARTKTPPKKPASARAAAASAEHSPLRGRVSDVVPRRRASRVSSSSEAEDGGLESAMGIFANFSPQRRGKNENVSVGADKEEEGARARVVASHGATTSTSGSHHQRPALTAGRGNPLDTKQTPTLAPDTMRLTPSQHW